MDWSTPCAYNAQQKQHFHVAARERLGKLAELMGWPKGSYDLRSNKAGIAVSGEITLHGEHLYIQVSQPCFGADTGILIRSCKGRKDYRGGPNHFMPLSLLDDLESLARFCQGVVQPRPGKPAANAITGSSASGEPS